MVKGSEFRDWCELIIEHSMQQANTLSIFFLLHPLLILSLSFSGLCVLLGDLGTGTGGGGALRSNLASVLALMAAKTASFEAVSAVSNAHSWLIFLSGVDLLASAGSGMDEGGFSGTFFRIKSIMYHKLLVPHRTTWPSSSIQL